MATPILAGLGFTCFLLLAPAAAAQKRWQCPFPHITGPAHEVDIVGSPEAQQRLRSVESFMAEAIAFERTGAFSHVEPMLQEMGLLLLPATLKLHDKEEAIVVRKMEELGDHGLWMSSRFIPFRELGHMARHPAVAVLTVAPVAGTRQEAARLLVEGEIAEDPHAAILWIEGSHCALLSGLGARVARWSAILAGKPLPLSAWSDKPSHASGPEATAAARDLTLPITFDGENYVFDFGSAEEEKVPTVEAFLNLVSEVSGWSFTYSEETEAALRAKVISLHGTHEIAEEDLLSSIQIVCMIHDLTVIAVGPAHMRLLQIEELRRGRSSSHRGALQSVAPAALHSFAGRTEPITTSLELVAASPRYLGGLLRARFQEECVAFMLPAKTTRMLILTGRGQDVVRFAGILMAIDAFTVEILMEGD